MTFWRPFCPSICSTAGSESLHLVTLYFGGSRASVGGSVPRSVQTWQADRLVSRGASASHSPALERVTHSPAGSQALLPVGPPLGVALLACLHPRIPTCRRVPVPSPFPPLISCRSLRDFSTPGREARARGQGMAGVERRHVPQRSSARDSATRLSKNLGSGGVGKSGFWSGHQGA